MRLKDPIGSRIVFCSYLAAIGTEFGNWMLIWEGALSAIAAFVMEAKGIETNYAVISTYFSCGQFG